jgi:hypothetical protein
MSKFIKSFISTLVLFFLIHAPLQAGNFVNLPKDVASGNKYKKSLDRKYKKYGMEKKMLFLLRILL